MYSPKLLLLLFHKAAFCRNVQLLTFWKIEKLAFGLVVENDSHFYCLIIFVLSSMLFYEYNPG